MKSHVTVVPVDMTIGVEGEFLQFPFSVAEADVWAVQWYEGAGHIEFRGRPNQALAGEADYNRAVAPFVVLFEQEKARRQTEAEAAEAARVAAYNSVEARAGRIRAERDARLSGCDFRMCADVYAAMNAADQTAWAAYRQGLRDLPNQPGFPWEGWNSGAELTADEQRQNALVPWPTEPGSGA